MTSLSVVGHTNGTAAEKLCQLIAAFLKPACRVGVNRRARSVLREDKTLSNGFSSFGDLARRLASDRRFLGMAMTFPGAKLLPGWHRVFLGIGQMLPGTPELFLGAFLLLGKTPPFPGTLKQFLGISIAPSGL
jgi:hypothetical protein